MSKRWSCRALSMIWFVISDLTSTRLSPSLVHLVVNICNVHHKMNIIAEIIRQNASEDILGNIVSI